MRRILKRTLELGLVRSGLADSWQRMLGWDAVVLAYHNVVPEGNSLLGDSSLHLPLAAFQAQVDLLSRSHAIVPLPDLLQAVPGRGRPLAAITFDDAYRGALELAVQELIRRGLPSTVFVPPGLLGCEGFWWDRLADPATGAIPRDFRLVAFHDLGGRQEPILERARSLGLRPGALPDLYRPASEGEVDSLIGDPLVTLGSHTWSHVHLASVPAPEAEHELLRSLRWLQERSVSEPFVLSYPYGAVRRGLEIPVRDAGYAAACLIEGGAVRIRDLSRDPFAVSRLNVPRGLSTEGFQARLAGAWPG